MITLSEIDPSAAPKFLAPVLECLFWIAGFIAAVGVAIKTLRGKPSAPPNEQLAATTLEICRRIDRLESENIKVWQKMEADRIECLRGASDMQADLSAVASKLAEVKDSVNLLRLNVDQIKRK
jgi:hypothetical protein